MSFISEIAKTVKRDLTAPFGYVVINFNGAAAYVEGFNRIINVTPDKIEFLQKKCVITVYGKGLSLASVDDGTALIEGEIGGIIRE